MNSVNLIGRLTKDPDIKVAGNSMNVGTFILAIARLSKEKETDFIRVTCFGKTAENVGKYLSKGQQTAITGSIKTGSYEDKNGKLVYTTDIIADRVEFLGSAKPKDEEAPASF